MKRSIVVCCLVVAGTAFAQGSMNPNTGTNTGKGTTATTTKSTTTTTTTGMPQGQMDMTQMGPWTRKVANEGQVKNEVMTFLKQEESPEVMGNFEAAVARVDFPIYMMTDSKSGMVEAKEYTREQYTAMMKPMYENMPKDTKWQHKPTITVLSDSMVNVVDDYTMTMGKQKLSGKNTAMLVKRNGQWKWKSMAEAGWGGMSPSTGGSGVQQGQQHNTMTK